MKKFAERLKELRLEKGLSQHDLSKVLNGQITHAAICFWEQAKRIPKLDALIILADYFDVTLDYLVGREY